MKNDNLNLPLDIYVQHLRSLKGIEFTQREVDILSCLVKGKSTRTIPSFLSIAARTVASHISRIRLKMGCTSQETIIDFVGSSDKASILKEQYYASLCNQVSFEKLLRKIPKVESAKAPLCLIVYEREQKDQYSFIHYLETHLKLAGFQTEIKVKEGQKSIIDFLGEQEIQQNDHILFIVPESLEFHQIVLDCHKEKCIFLLPDKIEDLEKLDHINYVDFSGTGNYYFSFFDLLIKLKKDFNFDKIIGDFKQSCEEIVTLPETIEAATYPEKQKSTNARFLQVSLKQRVKIVSFVFLMGSFIFISLFVVHWSLKTSNTHSIRSDLPIPTESAFLNRSGLLAQLDDKLKGQTGIQTISLVGIGGAGKTTLARQYAHSQRLSLVWEINAETKKLLLNPLKA